jgi:hypothetical protein
MFTLEVLSAAVAGNIVILLKNLTTPPPKVSPRLPHRRAIPLFKVNGNNEGELSVMTKPKIYLTKILSFSIKLRIAK